MDDLFNISNDGCTLISVNPNASGIVVIPEGITHIGDWAFSGSRVEEVVLPTSLKSFGERVFEHCLELSKISIHEGLEELPFCLFSGCISLYKIDLPESLTAINTLAFSRCISLRELHIPDNVKYIGDGAFEDCTALYSCNLPMRLETIEQSAFSGCSSLSSIRFTNSLKHIGYDAFFKCASIGYIFIPEAIQEIEAGAFRGTKAYVEVDENNASYSSFGGSLYDKNKEILYHYFANSPHCNINYPKTLKTIESGAFQGLDILREVILCTSIETIESFAFYDCKNLQNIVLPDSLISFSGCPLCPKIERINLPDSIEHIGQGAFQSCSSLRSIKLPKNLKSLVGCCESRAFQDCFSLEKVELNDSLESIGRYTFSGCTSLKEITLPPSTTSVDDRAFKNCASLEKVTCLSDIIDISSTAFLGCVGLRHLEISNFQISDLYVKFAECINLETITYLQAGMRRTADVNEFRHLWGENLKQMSMFYYDMNMNVVPIKGTSNNVSSFKKQFEGDGFSISALNNSRLDKQLLLNLAWPKMTGIATVLGWHRLQAIDVDNVHNASLIPGIIKSCLSVLGLPSDYPWVTISGSGRGFHIIYYSDVINKNVQVYSYASAGKEFEWLEVRISGILVLPPSIHWSGNYYNFWNKETPSIYPFEITTDRLNNLLIETCGVITFRDCMYNGVSFELCEVKKIKANRSSCPDDTILFEDDSIEWLSKCFSSHAHNSQAIHILTKEYDPNLKQIVRDLFNLANNDASFFNIASLIAVGYFPGSKTEVEYFISKIDIESFASYEPKQNSTTIKDKFDRIRNNANKCIKKEDMYLFFDTETTGIPKDYDAPSSDTDNWPRLVQLAWILTDGSGNRLKTGNLIIKPSGFSIPSEAAKIHGITTSKAKEVGVPINEAIAHFKADLDMATCIVGHNVSFDKRIVGAEMIRLNMEDTLDAMDSVCTMKSSINLCKLPGYYGYKYPKLQELYIKLFGESFDKAHNAMSDIEATERCFWELKRLRWV